MLHCQGGYHRGAFESSEQSPTNAYNPQRIATPLVPVLVPVAPVHGELPLKRRLAVQTTSGNGFANGNSQGKLPEELGRLLSPRACRRITLGAHEPRCSSF